MSDDIEQLDSPNQPTEEVENSEVLEEATPSVDEPSETSKLQELNKRLYERAKKAEAEAKELKSKLKPQEKPVSNPSDTGLSQKDLIAIIQANIPQEDIDDVVEYAKLKKLTLAEALKTNVVKTILSEKAEERKTADATNTGSSKRGTAKVSDEALIEKASKGELPESDADIARLVKARKGLK